MHLHLGKKVAVFALLGILFLGAAYKQVVAQTEPNMPSKEELLEEALYGQYIPYLGKEYSNFIQCPQIQIERIQGDTRRHLVHASALNYEGHHAPSYDKIQFILTDTPESGVKIKNITIHKNVSEEESLRQCRKSE
jgi:hypothetical protein